jgi:hypothetical protein
LLTLTGVLVECEPAIKSILVHIDSNHHHEFIIEDLDDTHLFIKEAMLPVLKQKLEEVSFQHPPRRRSALIAVRSVSKRRTGRKSLWRTVTRQSRCRTSKSCVLRRLSAGQQMSLVSELWQHTARIWQMTGLG